MIRVINDIKEQHVLPWFMWSGISQTTCPAMIRVIRNFSKQHVLSCFMWSGISHTLVFVHPLERVLLFFRYRFIFTRIKLGIIFFFLCIHLFVAFYHSFGRKFRKKKERNWKNTNTNLWFTLVSMSRRFVFLKYQVYILSNFTKCN